MSRVIDLTGERFGACLVLGNRDRNDNGQTTWLCRCDCGTVRDVVGQSLRVGVTNSCGCLKGPAIAKARTKHGASRTKSNPDSRTYQLWQAMRARVAGRSEMSKRYYVPKGIVVCGRWNDFANFLADMGEAPEGRSLDRIDGSKDYSPDNCRWATAAQQGQNRSNVKLDWFAISRIRLLRGKMKAEILASQHGIHPNTVFKIWRNEIWVEA